MSFAINVGLVAGLPEYYRTGYQVVEGGDSGGPSFRADTHQIVAVTSSRIPRSGTSPGDSWLARTDPHISWILETVRAYSGSSRSVTAWFDGDDKVAACDASGAAYYYCAHQCWPKGTAISKVCPR